MINQEAHFWASFFKWQKNAARGRRKGHISYDHIDR